MSIKRDGVMCGKSEMVVSTGDPQAPVPNDSSTLASHEGYLQ